MDTPAAGRGLELCHGPEGQVVQQDKDKAEAGRAKAHAAADAEYAAVLDIDLDNLKEPILCAPNDPDDARLLKQVQSQPDRFRPTVSGANWHIFRVLR